MRAQAEAVRRLKQDKADPDEVRRVPKPARAGGLEGCWEWGAVEDRYDWDGVLGDWCLWRGCWTGALGVLGWRRGIGEPGVLGLGLGLGWRGGC